MRALILLFLLTTNAHAARRVPALIHRVVERAFIHEVWWKIESFRPRCFPGLWPDWPKSLRFAKVFEGSALHRAGLRSGDAVHQLSLEAARLTIEILRDGVPVTIVLEVE